MTDLDAGHPTKRLSEADKQVSLAVDALAAESEALAPDAIRRLEGAAEMIRAVDRELRTLESVREEEGE